MKNFNFNILLRNLFALAFFFLLFTTPALIAQNTRIKVAVLNIDSKDLTYLSAQMGNLTRLELDKLDTFEVMDTYDIRYMVRKDSLDISDCYGKICLVEIGEKIKADKMLSGTAEYVGDKIIMTMKFIDVKNQSVERVKIIEFIYNPLEIQTMINLTLRELFGLKNDPDVMDKLTKKNTYEGALNNPYADILRLNGPRLGFTIFTGTTANYLKASRSDGGFDAFPMMFQFGYQFEKQYLNEGNFQALVEVIPMVTGLDQGLCIPSLTIMQGMRNNKNGLEFALGPTFGLLTEAQGYYEEGKWHLKEEWKDTINDNPNPIVWRTDSRGELRLHSGFVFAFGKTFKSGKMNIPVNAYIIPARNGLRFGASFGFNARKGHQVKISHGRYSIPY